MFNIRNAVPKACRIGCDPYGKLYSKVDTAPVPIAKVYEYPHLIYCNRHVPILMANQEGVKFLHMLSVRNLFTKIRVTHLIQLVTACSV